MDSGQAGLHPSAGLFILIFRPHTCWTQNNSSFILLSIGYLQVDIWVVYSVQSLQCLVAMNLVTIEEIMNKISGVMEDQHQWRQISGVQCVVRQEMLRIHQTNQCNSANNIRVMQRARNKRKPPSVHMDIKKEIVRMVVKQKDKCFAFMDIYLIK